MEQRVANVVLAVVIMSALYVTILAL